MHQMLAQEALQAQRQLKVEVSEWFLQGGCGEAHTHTQARLLGLF
jgi:hypothetical protein